MFSQFSHFKKKSKATASAETRSSAAIVCPSKLEVLLVCGKDLSEEETRRCKLASVIALDATELGTGIKADDLSVEFCSATDAVEKCKKQAFDVAIACDLLPTDSFEFGLSATAAASVSSVHSLRPLEKPRALAAFYTAVLAHVSPSTFRIVFDIWTEESGLFRQELTRSNVNMGTFDKTQVSMVLEKIRSRKQCTDGTLQCPYPECGVGGMDAFHLWVHCPLFHIKAPNRVPIQCPICEGKVSDKFQVHLHNEHFPAKAKAAGHCPEESGGGTESYIFSLVVCRRPSDGKYLLTEEFASVGFWIPGGAVDSGENPVDAAIRETLEEAGVRVLLKGLLKVEFNAHRGRHRHGDAYNRMRFIFYAEPVSERSSVKGVPDYESSGAVWLSADEVLSGKLKLRGSEPFKWISYLEADKPIHDIDILEIYGVSKYRDD